MIRPVKRDIYPISTNFFQVNMGWIIKIATIHYIRWIFGKAKMKAPSIFKGPVASFSLWAWVQATPICRPGSWSTLFATPGGHCNTFFKGSQHKLKDSQVRMDKYDMKNYEDMSWHTYLKTTYNIYVSCIWKKQTNTWYGVTFWLWFCNNQWCCVDSEDSMLSRWGAYFQ